MEYVDPSTGARWGTFPARCLGEAPDGSGCLYKFPQFGATVVLSLEEVAGLQRHYGAAAGGGGGDGSGDSQPVEGNAASAAAAASNSDLWAVRRRPGAVVARAGSLRDTIRWVYRVVCNDGAVVREGLFLFMY